MRRAGQDRRALFASLKRQAEKYCSLIYCERKTLFLRLKSTAEQGKRHVANLSFSESKHGTCLKEPFSYL
jgi:hypothetical protein